MADGFGEELPRGPARLVATESKRHAFGIWSAPILRISKDPKISAVFAISRRVRKSKAMTETRRVGRACRCWIRDGAPAVFRRAPSAPARSVRVSHDSDPASGHDSCLKPLPLPNPNLRLTHFVTPEALNTSPLAGRRGRSNQNHPAAQATLSNATASAHFSTWPPNPNQTALPLRIDAADPAPHPT